jgi:RHS repeat-associated protein
MRLAAWVLLAGALASPAHAEWTPSGASGQSTLSLSDPGKALALASAARVLVVAQEDNRLAVVNPDTGSVLGHVALPYEPQAVAISADGARAYVVYGNSRLTAVNLSARSVIATWTIGGELRSLVLTSGETELAVADAGPNRLLGVSTATGAINRQLALAHEPRALVRADGDAKLVVGAVNGWLITVDGGSFSVLSQRKLADEIRSLAWWQAGARALAVHKRADSVSLVDVAANQVTGVVALDGDPDHAAVAQSSGIGYVAMHDDASVNRVDLAGPALLGRYAIAARSNALLFDPGANVLYGALRNDSKLVRLDPATASLISVLELRKQLRDVAINPASHTAVAVADKSDEMFVIKLSDRSVRMIALPARPDLVAVDSVLNRAAIAFRGSGARLRFADLAAGTLYAGSIALEKNLSAIAIDPTRALLLGIVEGERPVLFVDMNARARLADGPSGRYRAAALHSGRGVAYLATEDRKLEVLDLATRTVTARVELGFKATIIAVDEALDRALITTDSGDRAHVLNLASLALEVSRTLPRHPGALALQSDTHVAVVASRESDKLSLVDLASGGLTAGFTTIDKPHALAVSTRFNQALVLSGERDEIAFVELPNPVPVLETLFPAAAPAGNAALVLTVNGKGFVEASRVFFGGSPLATRWVSAVRLEADVPAALLAVAASVAVTVRNPAPAGGISNALTFSLGGPILAIGAVAPASAEVGALITLSGTGFDPVPAGNQLTFRGINNTPVAATPLTATPTVLTLRVPPLAESGPIALSNSRGTAQSPAFTVVREQDFQLVVSPAALTVYQGASSTLQAQLSSTGTKAFTRLVTLSVHGLPAGVQASFAPAASLSASQAGAITVAATTTAAPGSYPVTIQAASSEGGAAFVRSSAATLNVVVSTGVTGVKGRFVTPEGQGIAGIIVRADIPATTQPQTTTDAAGNFQLAGLPAGTITFRFDATPANPLYPIWPYSAVIAADRVTVMRDWIIAPPPADERFKTIVPGSAQEQRITDERYPGLAITIPAGVSIVGWDGVTKTRMAVERLEPDRLPVSPPPIPTRSVYQLFFGTPMGGIANAPIPVTLPNDGNLRPGERTQLWYYDGSPMGGTGEWKQGGTGTVSPDGKVIVTDPGSGIPRFCGVCGLPCFLNNQADDPPPPPPPMAEGGQDGSEDPADAGDPADEGDDNDNTDQEECTSCPCETKPTGGGKVTLAIGQELLRATDLGVGGLVPLQVSRRFHPRDAFNNIAGTNLSLGLGWAFGYDIALLPASSSFARLVLAGNDQADFTPDGAGGFQTLTDPRFAGATLRSVSNGWELRFKNGRVWRFEQFGLVHLLTEKRDANGNRLVVSRAGNGRIQSVQGGQRSLAFIYGGGNGFVSQVRDGLGRTVDFTYNAQNRLDTVTAPDGGVTRYTYVDDSEFPAMPACNSTPGGVRLKTIQRPGQTQLQTLFYGPGRRVLRETLPNGEENRFSYSVVGACVTHVSNPTVACTANCPTVDSWENFEAGWRIWGGTITETALIDGRGQSRSQRFDGRRLGSATTDALGQTTRYTRDPVTGRTTSITDALGRTSSYSYDTSGNLTRLVDPLGRAIDVAYDPTWNKVTSITRRLADGTAVTERFEYDASNGNLISRTDPLNNVTTYSYTLQGQLKTVTIPGNRTTSFDYNAAGDLIGVTNPLGNTTAVSRDTAGRLIGTIDALGFVRRLEYDAADRLTQVVDENLGLTRFDYDSRRDMTSVVNPLNVTIQSYQYDPLHRLTQKTDAKLKSSLFQYDPAGNLIRFTDRRGQLSSFAYDEQNRILRVDYPDGISQTRSYDAAGRLAEVREAGNAVSYAYDDADRTVRVTTESPAGRHEVGYEYDTFDRVVRRTVNGTDPTTYTYDNASRPLTIGYRNQTTTYTWDNAGRLTSKTLPDGIRQEFGYDDDDRVTRLTYKRLDGTVIEAMAYEYDARGQRVAETSTIVSANETAFTGTYDDANRLTSITLTAAGQSFALAYDDNGNLVRKTDLANPANVTTYTWDSRDRLTAINAPGIAASFTYDVWDRRTSKTVNGQTMGYVYDGSQVIGEVTAGAISATILTTLAIDDVIARYSQEGARTYLTDALGSVIALAKDDQSIQSYYSYSPYGEVTVLGDDERNPIQYTARENDRTGLTFYRARYYDPVLKRFISEDPIGLAGGLNFYAYVDGDPTGFSDPFGHKGSAGSRANRSRRDIEREINEQREWEARNAKRQRQRQEEEAAAREAIRKMLEQVQRDRNPINPQRHRDEEFKRIWDAAEHEKKRQEKVQKDFERFMKDKDKPMGSCRPFPYHPYFY